MTYTITGTIYETAGKPVSIPSLIVSAHEVSIGGNALLAEAPSAPTGKFELSFEAARSGKLHLQLKASAPTGELIGQSEVAYEVSAKEEINIQVGEKPAYEALLTFFSTEYGKLLTMLRFRLRGTGLSPEALNEKDIQILLRSFKNLPFPFPVAGSPFNLQNLTLLAHSERLALESKMPGSFFYGTSKMVRVTPMELPTFLGLSDAQIKRALRFAAARHFISEMDLSEILERADELRRQNGSLERRRLAVQLVDKGSQKPLAYHRVEAVMPGKAKELGEALTDEKGLAIFYYFGKKEEAQPFKLSIFGFDKQALLTTNVQAKENLVKVEVPASPKEDTSPEIKKLNADLGLQLSENTLRVLEREQMLTLSGFLEKGGLLRLESILQGPDQKALLHLERHAEMYGTLSGYQSSAAESLIRAGFSSVGKIAASGRANFVKRTGKTLGNYQAASLWKQAKVGKAVLDNLMAGAQLGDIPRAALAGNAVQTDCACSNCVSAASPAAYLSDLMEYLENHLQIGAEGDDTPTMAILEDLESEFHQPFGDLPFSCEQVEVQFRQVRLCIEVLRRYLAAKQLPAANSPQDLALQSANRLYLETAYTTLLHLSGTSPSELRKTVLSTDVGERNRLSSRLGLPSASLLERLLLDPDLMTEADLEHLFGLRDTTRDALSEGLPMQDDGTHFEPPLLPIKRWNPNGIRWNRNTDPEGYLWISISQPEAGKFRAEVFRDEARTSLLASGESEEPDGVITLSSEAGSGLSGSFQLNGTAPAAFKISAVPLLLSWRLATFYSNNRHANGEKPLLDPDLIGLHWLRLPVESNPAFDILMERRAFIAARLEAYRAIEPDGNDVERLDALLASVNLPLSEAGEELLPAESARLLGIRQQINQPSALPLLNLEWEEVYAILAQVEKRRLAAAWLTEEQDAGIALSPDFFQTPEPSPSDEQLPVWRATQEDLQIFRNALNAITGERQAMEAAFQEIIDRTEERTLTSLREALILASDAPGANLPEKAAWVEDYLLVNARMDGCMNTTRIAQAIDVLQRIVWSVRTGQMTDTRPGWEIVSDNFDEEWKWIGTYATWKSAIMVFLYPENLLHPALRRHKTPAFEAINEAFRDKPRLTPEDACKGARAYSEFANDLPKLKLEATCSARVQLQHEKCTQSSLPESDYLLFLFARSEESGKTYLSTYRSGVPTGEEQAFWERIPFLTNVLQIVGACVYEFETNKPYRFIYLFAKQKTSSGEQLAYLRYDLERRRWEETGPLNAGVPMDATSFRATIKQKNEGNTPPELAIQVGENVSFYRMDKAGTLLAEALPNSSIYLHDQGSKLQLEAVVAMDNFPRPDYNLPQYFLVIASGLNGQGVHYRFFPPASPFQPGSSYAVKSGKIIDTGIYKGVAFWPDSPNVVYMFYEEANELRYKVLFNDAGDFGMGPRFDTVPFQRFGTLPPWNNLDSVPVHTGANQVPVFDYALGGYQYAIGYQRGGEKAGPFLGFFQRSDSPQQPLNRAARAIGPGLGAVNFNQGGPALLRRRPLVMSGGIGDGLILDDGGDWPPPPPPPPPIQPENLYLSLLESVRLIPILEEPVVISPATDGKILQIRRAKIQAAFEDNELLSASLRSYLEEAFYFLPVLIALNLQRRGFYLEALDWYRTVYDYTQVESLRKIYYGLVREETFLPDYERAAAWLLDPLNPHSIAQNRPNAYSRYTILSIVKCLLEFGNSEFARDTAESVSKASLLYRAASDLLPLLRDAANVSACQAIIEETSQLMGQHFGEGVRAVSSDILTSLSRISSLSDLQGALEDIEMQLSASGGETLALKNISKAVNSRKRNPSISPTLRSFAVTTKRQSQVALLGDARVSGISQLVTWAVEQDYDHSFYRLTGQKKDVLAAAELPWLAKKESAPVLHKPLLRDEALRRPAHFQVLRDLAKGTPYAVLQGGQQFQETYLLSLGNTSFCIPSNPRVASLSDNVSANIKKINQCRNLAGFERDLAPYSAPIDVESALPSTSYEGNLVLPNSVSQVPTFYRFRFLVERAKQIAFLAQQMEATFLSVLEKRDAEFYHLLKAKQDETLSFAGVRLHGLRLREAKDGVRLSILQQERTRMQEKHLEEMANKEDDFFSLENMASLAISVGTVIAGIYSKKPDLAIQGITGVAGAFLGGSDLGKQLDLARQDSQISNQMLQLSRDREAIAAQELGIANLQATHSQETLNFLVNKFTNLDLYDWMSHELESVYSAILQQATAVARLSAQQLAFERQATVPGFIQSDYWEAPLSMEASPAQAADTPSRRGLTGSARLLQDIFQLEQHALDTEQRKQHLTKIISLAQLSPAVFQQFRETGRLFFNTPMELFDRDFPGHYLRLIQRVRVSLVALIPPIEGVKATLSASGISRVVVESQNTFKETIIHRLPESVSLTSAFNASGQFDFELQLPNDTLRPFEGCGVEGFWIFDLPKPANLFDYNTIADVLFTLDYTAIYNETYKRRVALQMNRTFLADRAFSFRNEFADQWYDLHHPELVPEDRKMRASFNIRREDFPANLANIKMQHLSIYFSRKNGSTEEISSVSLAFMGLEGVADTVNGLISTRLFGGIILLSLLDANEKSPVGEWALSLPNEEVVINRFKEEEIEDILIVITFEGLTSEWQL